CAHAYLDALKNSADASVKNELIPHIVACDSYDKLVGFYNSLLARNPTSYTEGIRDELDHFVDQIAGTIASDERRKGGGKPSHDRIVKMNAYGRMRYAHVTFWDGSNNPNPFGGGASYDFISWVTPDM